jgi:2-(1,2-epoxy-1,2-dihydrophenyl)acetyl-CoA isomerase
MPEFETILLSKTDGIATITLNRPDAANGINPTLAAELVQAALDCDHDESIRCVILTANGKMFCAGGDLKSVGGEPDAAAITIKGMADNLHRATSTFARMQKPFVVAVTGMAAGAGFSIAVTGDFVIAAESAKFTMAYTAAGLSPDGSSSYFLPRIIGVRKTTELMMSNRRLTAQEALEWGLINQVVPDAELHNAANELAKRLASGPTDAFGVVKKLLLCSFDNSLETQMELEGRAISMQAAAPNGQEGVRAFLEKRQPEFNA